MEGQIIHKVKELQLSLKTLAASNEYISREQLKVPRSQNLETDMIGIEERPKFISHLLWK